MLKYQRCFTYTNIFLTNDSVFMTIILIIFTLLKVKRVAMAEMQRAVTLAERRALDSVTCERIKMEKLLLEAASVSGVSGSISPKASLINNTLRKPDINILDAAINSERSTKNEKMNSETMKRNTEEDSSALQGIRQNENSSTEECLRTGKTKVNFLFIPYTILLH